MVPARNLPHLLRDAHGAGATPPFGVTAAPPASILQHMAQEPLDQHRRDSSNKQPPPPPSPPPQESQAEQLAPRPLVASQEAAGTSCSSSGNGGAGDWLRLGLTPASPAAGSQSQLDLFSDRVGPLVQPQAQQPRPFMGTAVPAIPQAAVTLPAPRAGPPWMTVQPWSAVAAAFPAAAPPMLPFAHRTFYTPGGAGSSCVDAIRVVLPPPAAGVWFALQAAPNQGREPFLPQIPRSYLRIKDVRVTVRLLIMYLVRKLGLEDESEVEITCRGRPLLPFLTLQHVRDSIWCQGDAVSTSMAPDISTIGGMTDGNFPTACAQALLLIY